MTPLQENVDYSITVITDDIRGNGTDGNVYVTLIGDKGESDELQLSPQDDGNRLFERNATDKFLVSATDVGVLQGLRVKMCASWWSSVHSDWHLQEVQVLNSSSGVNTVFAHNGWVVQDSAVTLAIASSDQVFHDYKIAVVGQTGNILDQGYNCRIRCERVTRLAKTKFCFIDPCPDSYCLPGSLKLGSTGMPVTRARAPAWSS